MVARGFGPTDPTPGERVTAANAAMDAEYFTQQHTFELGPWATEQSDRRKCLGPKMASAGVAHKPFQRLVSER